MLKAKDGKPLSPIKNTTLPKIDLLKEHLERPVKSDKRRAYLGMSQLGDDCDRAIYYIASAALATKEISVNITVEQKARQMRIFRMGDIIEELVIRDLKATGVEFESEQNHYSVYKNIIQGHSDGVVIKVPTAPKSRHLLEVKSMADKYFKQYKKAGEMRKHNRKYWIQANLYAHEESAERILFIVENKNDQSRIYERAEVDHNLAEYYLNRGIEITKMAERGQQPPERLKDSPHQHPCNWCQFREQCHS